MNLIAKCTLARWVICLIVLFGLTTHVSASSVDNAPSGILPVINALEQSRWEQLQDGLAVKRALVPGGLIVTAYKIDPRHFSFSVSVNASDKGSTAKSIGEREGAVLSTNAGFFAISSSGDLYPVGYLRIDGSVLAKSWSDAGGTISFVDGGVRLLPTSLNAPI